MDPEPKRSKTRETCLLLPSPMFIGAFTPAEVPYQRFPHDPSAVGQEGELMHGNVESHQQVVRYVPSS